MIIERLFANHKLLEAVRNGTLTSENAETAEEIEAVTRVDRESKKSLPRKYSDFVENADSISVNHKSEAFDYYDSKKGFHKKKI